MNDLPALFLRLALAAGLFLHGGPVATVAALVLLTGYQLRAVATVVAPTVRNRALAIDDCTCAGVRGGPAWRRWLASTPE